MSETPDSEGLIENNIYAQVALEKYTIYRYILLKIIPITLLYISASLLHELKSSNFVLSAFKTIILTSLSFIEFWFQKNSDGIQLIGMRWFHFITENGEAKIACYARTDPYVPNAAIFHMFWAFSYTFTFLWLLTVFLSLFLFENNIEFCISIFAFNLELINLIFFKRCNNEWQKQTDDIARTIMLGDAFNSDEDEENVNPTSEEVSVVVDN